MTSGIVRHRRVELFPMPLRQALSRIPIPLRDQDAEVSLDLQELVGQAYCNGRYDHTDYGKPCDPPLEPEDAQWADECCAPRACAARHEPARSQIALARDNQSQDANPLVSMHRYSVSRMIPGRRRGGSGIFTVYEPPPMA
jgi:hypothetical protein